MTRLKTIGDVTRPAREEKGWSLRTLALKVKLSASYLSRLENGEKNATPQTLTKIAKALGIDQTPLHQISALRAGWKI